MNEKAGSTNRSANLICPPGMGKYAIISPRETITLKQMVPTAPYPSSKPIGPPFWSEPAVPYANDQSDSLHAFQMNSTYQEKTSTNHTANGNHSNMTILQLTLQGTWVWMNPRGSFSRECVAFLDIIVFLLAVVVFLGGHRGLSCTPKERARSNHSKAQLAPFTYKGQDVGLAENAQVYTTELQPRGVSA